MLVASGRCPAHQATVRKQHDEVRGTSAQRGYDSRWRKVRASYLRSHPTCAACAQHGRLTAASVVDHIVPHRGDRALFWSYENWQALCVACHNRKTATHDGGFGRG